MPSVKLFSLSQNIGYCANRYFKHFHKKLNCDNFLRLSLIIEVGYLSIGRSIDNLHRLINCTFVEDLHVVESNKKPTQWERGT